MTFDEIVKSIEEGGWEVLLATMDQSIFQLLNAATDLFEQFKEVDQMMALAIMWGSLAGSIEGEPNQWERENKSFITYADRMKLFTTLAQVTFDAAMKARQDPNCPQPRRM